MLDRMKFVSDIVNVEATSDGKLTFSVSANAANIRTYFTGLQHEPPQALVEARKRKSAATPAAAAAANGTAVESAEGQVEESQQSQQSQHEDGQQDAQLSASASSSSQREIHVVSNVKIHTKRLMNIMHAKNINLALSIACKDR